MLQKLIGILLIALTAVRAFAAITITGVADKAKYNNTVTFTITADPGAATTTATLDDVPTTVGSAVVVNSISYHELKAESRTAGNVLVDSKLVRFIVRDNAGRGDTETGIPPHTPYRTVNDAPSAFAGQTLKVIAPAAWPVGLPIPIATVLRSAANEAVWLNGTVTFGGFPGTSLQMRRGWGSVVAPAATAAGTLNVDAHVAGLAHNPAITIEAAPVFTNVSGAIAANTNWPANSRINITGTLTINAGFTLTIGAGTIVKIFSGTATNGTGAEIVVNGTLQVNGAEGSPVVFAPDAAGGNWGGIELPAATSNVTAQHAIFTGSGEDETWFSTHSGYSSHKPQQALFLLSGSGTGTAVGAQLHLTNCQCFSLAGQEMNSKTNTWVDLQRTLMQRAVTCGELNGSRVTIDRCALIEFPSEDATFVDGDNDVLYLTNGDFSLTNNVIGFSKDDGVDSGGDGGDNPFTAAADVTPYAAANNWFEGTYHEGAALSGTRNVTFTGCVFHQCGQGVEDGYSAGATADGPNATVDGCLFVSNMVGVRWGDSYSTYPYNGSMEVKNSFVLNSLYKDAFSGQWHPTDANGWIYETTAVNTFGRPYFNVHDNHLSQPDPLHHPSNTAWNPATNGALIAPFMPVPGSNVGVAISSYAPAQSDTSAYPGTFTVRLSTFSSRTVTVDYSVIGKTDPLAGADTVLASGTLNFAAGETLITISPTVTSPANYALIRVALSNPINAEVTGEAWYFKMPTTVSPTLIPFGAIWKYLADGSNQGTAWRNVNFNDSTWASGPSQLGYGGGTVAAPTGEGDEATIVPFIDTDAVAAGIQKNATTYFRRTFTVGDVSKIAGLNLSMIYDDGGVVYINGQRAAVTTTSTTPIPIDPSYNYFVGAPTQENATLSTAISPALLVNGLNTIAVEIHQEVNTSSDISFNLELTATFTQPFDLHVGRAGAQPILYWFDSAAMLESSTDLGNWTPLPAGPSPFPFSTGIPRQFFRLKK